MDAEFELFVAHVDFHDDIVTGLVGQPLSKVREEGIAGRQVEKFLEMSNL